MAAYSQKYPVGEQSFGALREEGYLYIDKTRFVEKLVNHGKYYFLGRPRRFGKSLFLSMLKCFFQGKRHLFRGLYADSMDWSWEKHPVLYLDLNFDKYKNQEALDETLISNLEEWEEEYGVERIAPTISMRFKNIIKTAHEKTGKRVVILVDEYDKPLVSNINDNELYRFHQDKLYSVYSNFKSSADHLKMVFLTGVSRFGKVSIFSGLNNIDDISFDDRYNDICGISEDELQLYFHEGITKLAEKFHITDTEIRQILKKRYDGYRFSPYGKDIYNPYSILKVMDKEMFDYFWIESGNPTLLAEQLTKFNIDLKSQLNANCTKEDLMGIDLNSPRTAALLYQTGYLTIKNYDENTRLFSLGLPNEEVTRGFMDFLLPYYANLHNEGTAFVVSKFVEEVRNGAVDAFMTRLQSMFSASGYMMKLETENNFHNALYILMLLAGLDVKTEYVTSDGRIDLLISTDKYHYIIELKKDSTAQKALSQIVNTGYPLPFSVDGKEIILIGANFSTKSRTLTDWAIKR